jgi:hypothetical protein
MIQIYGDESADEKKERVLVVSGVLGDTRQWESLAPKWIEANRGIPFHAADLESGHGDYEEIPEPERQKIHRQATRVLAESGLIGWGAAIDLVGAKHEFPQMSPNQPFFLAFFRTILYLSGKASLCVPQQTTEFVFDRNSETGHNSDLIYQYVESSGRYPLLSTKFSHASRKQHAGIQTADLYARELMKRFDSYLFNDHSLPRRQWSILMESKRFGGDFFCAEHFRDMKSRIPDLEKRTGASYADYREWLVKRKRIDNESNRIEWVIELQVEDMNAWPGALRTSDI